MSNKLDAHKLVNNEIKESLNNHKEWLNGLENNIDEDEYNDENYNSDEKYISKPYPLPEDNPDEEKRWEKLYKLVN